MRNLSPALLAGALGLAAAFLAACGASSGLLSASEGSSLTAQLNAASHNLSRGNCYGAQNAIGQLKNEIAHLPTSIDTTLVNDLSRGANTIGELANARCTGTVGTATHTSPPIVTTPTTTHPHTTSTPTSTSTTTSPTPTSTPTTPQTTTPTTPTTPSTPATSTPAPGTSPGGGGGAPTGGGGANGQGNGAGD